MTGHIVPQDRFAEAVAQALGSTRHVIRKRRRSWRRQVALLLLVTALFGLILAG